MHTQGMTDAQSQQLFLEGAFLDPGNARQQALRGTYDPAYLNYTLGKLMIRKLRDDWTATRGGRRSAVADQDRVTPPSPAKARERVAWHGSTLPQSSSPDPHQLQCSLPLLSLLQSLAGTNTCWL